jgi:uncharacterized membrane protein
MMWKTSNLRRPRVGSRYVLAVFLAAVTTGCEDRPAQLSPVPGLFNGHFMGGHEVRSFRPCGQDDELWVIDTTGSLQGMHRELTKGRDPYQAIFTVVEGRRGLAPETGFGADYAETLQVARVLYGGIEGPDCATSWGEFSFRGQGNEPFWMVEVSTGGMRLARPGKPDLVWTRAGRERLADWIRWTGDPDASSPSIELRLTRESCRDSMSGAFFGYSAMLRFGGEAFYGCGVKGAE